MSTYERLYDVGCCKWEITLQKTNVNDVEQLLLMATSVEATYVQDNKYGNPAELHIESFAYGCLNLSYYPY